ncbi:hypothetical protein H4217_002434 [Coemansia sp. RSA 1939]|nr:hypothetical protein H4217_002434 [Coemansia sp. RSA 1939]KAJ2588389.1 hypothetical protein EV177_009428 [Coemansia sp. RSA 1804]
MGQAVSKKSSAAAQAASNNAGRRLRLSRTLPQQQQQQQQQSEVQGEAEQRKTQQHPPPRLVTREEMLREAETDEGSEQQQNQNARLAENLKYFLNPKELLTPITPTDPESNANVQALRSRREDDDLEVVGRINRVKSSQITILLRELDNSPSNGGSAVDRVAAKYGMDKETVTQLARFLSPCV